MNSPFKMKPGRGNMLKTGRGIPLAMCSPIKQMGGGEDETTAEYDRGKKKIKEAAKNPETKAKIESGTGIKINAETGQAKPNLTKHSFKVRGNQASELDSEGKVVRSVSYSPMSPGGGDAAERMQKDIDRRNSYTERTQNKNADQYNAESGFTSPDKLSESQKGTLRNLNKIKKKGS